MIHSIVPPELLESEKKPLRQRHLRFEGAVLTANENGYITEIVSSDPALFLRVYQKFGGGFIPGSF